MGKIITDLLQVRPKIPNRLTLKTKLTLITVGMLLLALGVNSLISTNIFQKEYSEALISKGILVGQVLKVQLGRLLAIGLNLENLIGFEEQCQEAVAKYQVSFAMVADLNGKIVFHNDQSLKGKKIRDPLVRKALRTAGRGEAVVADSPNQVYHIMVPVIGMSGNGANYVIIVGLPLKTVVKKSNRLVRSSACVAIFCFILTLSLTYLVLSIWVTRPVYDLIATIKQIRNDRDWGLRVKVQSEDEIGILATAFNQMVDELHDSRNEILKQNQQLEQKVVERTVQLSEMNELLAQDIIKRRTAELELAKRAEELANSNAELKQFAYIASHDLKEPLRMISSYLQLLKRRYQDKLDAKAMEYIATTVDGAGRMHCLIDDILDLSRVGTNKFEFQLVECNEVLTQVLTNLEVMIRESAVTIEAATLPVVYADYSQLSRLFQNLIVNAIKFRSKTKPPRISITVDRVENGWKFSIADNGIGIESVYLERIFLIFQRLHTRSEYPGTGIGLAICKKIVERHGGLIWAESEPGQGSVFCFTLFDQKSG